MKESRIQNPESRIHAKGCGSFWILCALLAGCGSTGGGDDHPTSTGSSAEAVRLYQQGDFEKAEAEARAALSREPRDAATLRLLGRVYLCRNRLKESVEALTRAIEINQANKLKDYAPYQDLWLALYRMDDFDRAARCLYTLGEQVLAAKYAALAKAVPYVVRWDDEPAVLPFTIADPLPVVRLSVNGRPGDFAVDTGEGELVLDRKFAGKVRTHAAGSRVDLSGATLEEGFVDEVMAGSLFIRNIPVRIRDLKPVGRVEVQGSIGANFLLHFSFSIDAKKGRLVLYRATSPLSRAGTSLPFWIAGDRYLIARGTLSRKRGSETPPAESTFLHIHTGLAHVTLAPARGLTADGSRFSEAVLGPITLKNPDANPDAFVPGLDSAFGFVIAASLGHDALKGRVLTFEPEKMTLTIE